MVGAKEGTRSLDLAKNRPLSSLVSQIWLLRRLFWLISATEGWFELPAINWDTPRFFEVVLPLKLAYNQSYLAHPASFDVWRYRVKIKRRAGKKIHS